MKKEKKLKVLALLRKQEPNLVKHMMSREDFSSLASEREALRQARTEGRIDFLYKGNILSARFETETEENFIKKMAEKAKEQIEKEQATMGMPGEIPGAVEEPIMESKIKQNTLKRIILEEINNTLSEKRKSKVIGKTKGGRRIRRARAWIPKGMWPYKRFPAYWQGEPGKNASSKVHKASFRAFYKEAWKNPEAKRQLRSRDFRWGDQHADAYATLQERPGGVPGPKGKVKVTDPEARHVRAGEGGDPGTRDCSKAPTEKARLICQYEKAQNKLEKGRIRLKDIKKQMDELDRLARTGSVEERRKNYKKFRVLDAERSILIQKNNNLEELVKGYVKQIRQLAGKKYKASEGDIKRMRLFVQETAVDALRRAKRMKPHELGDDIRTMEALLEKGGIPSALEKKVREFLPIYKAEYQSYAR